MPRSLKERLKVPHRHRPNFSNPGATDPTDCSSMWTHRDWSQSQASVASPKVLEPVGRHFGVSDRVLDVPVAEVVLQRPRVVAIVGKSVCKNPAEVPCRKCNEFNARSSQKCRMA